MAATDNVNTNSSPSELRITDMRICDVRRDPLRGLILRIDTNQGISGYGDVRERGLLRLRALFEGWDQRLKSDVAGLRESVDASLANAYGDPDPEIV